MTPPAVPLPSKQVKEVLLVVDSPVKIKKELNDDFDKAAAAPKASAVSMSRADAMKELAMLEAELPLACMFVYSQLACC